MKSAPILTMSVALVVSACGFDSRKSDPMRDAGQSSYVSSSEKVLEQQKLEEKFLEETKAYKESIATIQKNAEENTRSLEESIKT